MPERSPSRAAISLQAGDWRFIMPGGEMLDMLKIARVAERTTEEVTLASFPRLEAGGSYPFGDYPADTSAT